MNDVSVVLCTYNGARYIAEQLASILDQTRPPTQIVVRDDGSTDATPDIVAAVAARTDVPVQFAVNPQRLGFADNFLTACRAATGTFIAFSDQDDRWKPEKLQRSVEALERNQAVLCSHAVGLMDAAGAVISEPPVDRAAAESLLGPHDQFHHFYGFTMTFRRSLLDRIPAEARGLDPYTPGEPLSHDRWVYFLASVFGRTVVLGEPLAYYRQHGGQLYGGEKAIAISERIKTKITAGAAQAEYLAGCADHFADLLSAPPAREPDVRMWQEGAQRWSRLAARYGDRARFYGKRSGPSRAMSLLGNVRRGVYGRPESAGLGRRRLLEDLTVLLAGPALRRSSQDRPSGVAALSAGGDGPRPD